MPHVLFILVFLPALGAAAVLAVRGRVARRWVAFSVFSATFLLSLSLLASYRWDRGVEPGDPVRIPSLQTVGIVRSVDPVARQAMVELGPGAALQRFGFAEVRLVGEYAVAADRGHLASGRTGFGVVQLVERGNWLGSNQAQNLLGIDGLSLPLVNLTTLLFLLVCVATWTMEDRAAGFLALLLMLETTMLGILLSLDLLLFFLFFELSLAPVYYLIVSWGGARRQYASLKFFIYSMVGAMALLIGVIAIDVNVHSLDLIELPHRAAAVFGPSGTLGTTGAWLFAAFTLAFLLRLAATPLHGWIVDAMAEAPAGLTMLIPGTFVMTGGYGLLRVAYPILPHAAGRAWLVMAVLGVIGIAYGALCALSHVDLKRLIAYASVSQTGVIVLGTATMTTASFNGAFFALVGQGLIAGLLSFLADVIERRAGHREIDRLGGLAKRLPRYWGFSAVAFFALLGLPGLSGFIGQVMALFGVFQARRNGFLLLAGHHGSAGAINTIIVLACIGLVFVAAVVVVTLRRIFFGPERAESRAFADLGAREIAVAAPLTLMIILLGLFPSLLVFSLSNKTVEAIDLLMHQNSAFGPASTAEGRRAGGG